MSVEFKRSDTNHTTLTASTVVEFRCFSAGDLKLYDASELRVIRGPNIAVADGAVAPTTGYDVIPAGQGDVIRISKRDRSRARRREGVEYVSVYVWSTTGSELRSTFDAG